MQPLADASSSTTPLRRFILPPSVFGVRPRRGAAGRVIFRARTGFPPAPRGISPAGLGWQFAFRGGPPLSNKSARGRADLSSNSADLFHSLSAALPAFPGRLPPRHPRRTPQLARAPRPPRPRLRNAPADLSGRARALIHSPSLLPFAPRQFPDFRRLSVANQVVWVDIPVLDLDRAIRFYS